MTSQLEQLLTCCICLDRFRNPKLLPCQHSVCMEPCMEGLVDYVRRQVKCPECRAEHRIPYNGVQGFPANVTLQRFLEAHIEITGETPDPHTGQIMERCGVCNEKNYLSTCVHCDKKICVDCKAAHADILKREIGRINNQVKRAMHRLNDQLSIVERNVKALKQNTDGVTEEIDNISKRLQKSIKDRAAAIRTEVTSYHQNEQRQLTLLKEGLEQEISNVTSNCELVEKHMDAQTEWDDAELMDTKDVFLRTVEFIRGFDHESGDYNRRAKFTVPDDINKLASTLSCLGDLVISCPKQTMDGFSSGGSTLGSSLGSGLSKSKSDHRLAAQFRDQDESFSYGSGRTSPMARSRRFGERPHIPDDPSPYESATDVGSRRRFRSRFIRRGEEEDERSVRFTEDDAGHNPKPRQKVIDTEDVSKGPLSGITRLIDAPRVIQRLQDKEGNFKRKKEETPKAATPVATPKAALTFGTPRKTARQMSEDEIDRIKKQNKSEASGSSTTTPKPGLERLNSLKENERSVRSDRTSVSPRSGTPGNLSPANSINEEETSRRSSRDLGATRSDYNSASATASTKSDSRTLPSSRSSSTSSVGESSKTTSPRSPKTDTTVTPTRGSRSNSTDSNNSALNHDDSKTLRNGTVDTKSAAGSSKYQSRLLGRAGTPSAETSKESVNDEEEEETTEESDTESEESSEEEEEETEEESVKSNYFSPKSTATPTYGRSSFTTVPPPSGNNDSSSNENSKSKYGASNTNDASSSRYGTTNGASSRYGTSNDNSSRYASSNANDASGVSSRRPSYYDNSKSPKENNDVLESKYPYASKFLSRSKTNAATEEEKSPFQSRFLNKSKSSALLGPDVNGETDTTTPAATGTSRAKFEELKERRQRLARSKSSAGMDDDETGTSTTSTTDTTQRKRYGRDSETPTSNSTTALTNGRSSSAHGSQNSNDKEETSTNQLSSWARYLKNKYGNKGGSAQTSSSSNSGTSSVSASKPSYASTSNGASSAKSISRSRSSHLLGLAKDDSVEEEPKNACATPTSPPVGTLATTPFGNIHRTQYLQKQRLNFKIGSRGSEAGNFTWPRGIAIGPDDSIVVADSSNHRVQVFGKDGRYIKDFGSYGTAEGEFDCLAGVAVNRIGQYIIADRYNHRIQIFDPSGMFLRSFGSHGTNDGKFSYPWGVATDSLGFIYVCDKENHRIQVFQSDGTFVGKFGSLGNKLGQLEHPHYIAVSSTNRVIVSDSNNHKIQVFDINGKVQTAFGSEGSNEGQFKFPRGVAVDEQGYIFVADSGNNRIQIFHPDGAFLRAFGCWGSGDGEFKGLEGVGVMSNGNILICDRENHRVQCF